MPTFEKEEDAAQRQKGQRLKILTPQQMITRLPILLAQLKAGNNSQKLKNEISTIRCIICIDQKICQKQFITI